MAYIIQTGNFGIGFMSGGTIKGGHISSDGIHIQSLSFAGVDLFLDFSDSENLKITIDHTEFVVSRSVKNKIVVDHAGVKGYVFGNRLFLQSGNNDSIDFEIS